MKRQIKKVSTQNMEVEKLIMFFFLFAIMCHNLSCLWFLVAKLQDFNENTWVYKNDYDVAPVTEQYLASLYFIVTTITTVGYGDITSKNPGQQIFCIILMIIGVIAYSMAISSFTNIMSAYNQKQKLLVHKLNILSQLRDQYNLSFEFYWRLRQSLHYEHTMDMSEKLDFVQQLPPKLNIELSNIMYTHQLADIKFFENKPPKFIASIAPKLKPLKVCKGQYIFINGDSLDGIYFIKKGEAAFVERRPRADLIFATNKNGSYFGQIDFVSLNSTGNPKRMFTVKAKTDMDLLFLDQDDLYSIDNEFKKELLSLFNNAFEHLDKLKSMNKRSKKWLQKRYTNFQEDNGLQSENGESSVSSSTITNKQLQKVQTLHIKPLELIDSSTLQYFQPPSSPINQKISQGRNSIMRSFKIQKQEYLEKIQRKKRSNSCYKRESKDNIKITLNSGKTTIDSSPYVKKNKTLFLNRIEQPFELLHSTESPQANKLSEINSDSDSQEESTQRNFIRRVKSRKN